MVYNVSVSYNKDRDTWVATCFDIPFSKDINSLDTLVDEFGSAALDVISSQGKSLEGINFRYGVKPYLVSIGEFYMLSTWESILGTTKEIYLDEFGAFAQKNGFIVFKGEYWDFDNSLNIDDISRAYLVEPSVFSVMAKYFYGKQPQYKLLENYRCNYKYYIRLDKRGVRIGETFAIFIATNSYDDAKRLCKIINNGELWIITGFDLSDGTTHTEMVEYPDYTKFL